MTATTTALDRFVEATRRKRKIEAELRIVKDELAVLQGELLDSFAEQGVRSQTTTDGTTVHINRRLWARAANGDKVAAARALARVPELSPFVEPSWNVNSLSAYFKERRKEREEETGMPVTDLTELLPAPVRGLIDLTEDTVLGVRA